MKMAIFVAFVEKNDNNYILLVVSKTGASTKKLKSICGTCGENNNKCCFLRRTLANEEEITCGAPPAAWSSESPGSGFNLLGSLVISRILTLQIGCLSHSAQKIASAQFDTF